MNKDILAGKWKQLRGKVQEKWGQLTDDELDKAEGRFDVVSGLLQERYGYAKDEAERVLGSALDEWSRTDDQPARTNVGR
ncbi:MAG TPA: CsbD family protein [Candidatus Binatia bacterium]|nr:CsbD family protein [Candidatus Binatia bacterium]